MSEVKHTPGPWRWSDKYESGDGRRTWSLLGKGGYGILSCDGVANSPQGLGDDANARLIAAAPDLLALVKLVHGSFGGGLTVTFSEQDVSEFAAAIAKAEGRE